MTVKTNQQAIVKGSVADVMRTEGVSLAEAFMDATHVAIVDTSGSMDENDARGYRSRYDVACEELAKLQTQNPGKVIVISFSGDPILCPNGYPTYQGGGTDLTSALEFVRQFDGAVSFVVISDGLPDSQSSALSVARSLTSRIDVVFVGPETETMGRQFMNQLAQRGGQSVTADRANELASKIKQLMLGAGAA